MTKKVKGLAVTDHFQGKEKFKFKEDGTSKLGESTEDSHQIKGQVNTDGTAEIDGELELADRLSGFVFSPPHIDASSELQIVQDLIDNAAAMYEGFLVYITAAAAGEPFNIGNKFYFCEDGTWHPSPFTSEIVNNAPQQNGIFSAIAAYTEELLSHTYAADFFTDADGDTLTYTAELVGGSPLPAWLAFDDSTRTLSGTPTSADEGTIFVQITATDPGGLTATISQQIDIIIPPPPTYSDPHVPFWNIPGVYQVGSDSDLTLDGQTTGVYHTAEATDATFNIMEHIPYGDTSTALVFEWAFDGSDTAGEGVRNAYTRIGLRSADQAGTDVRHFTMLPQESGRSTRGERTIPGTTTITTAWMSMNDNPADWTFRAILKVDSWFTDGSEKPRMVKWAIAGKKNSANIPWSSFISSTHDYGDITNYDGFQKWATFKYYGTNSSAGPTALNFYPFAQVRPETNNNTAEFHLTNPKVFFADLDE